MKLCYIIFALVFLVTFSCSNFDEDGVSSVSLNSENVEFKDSLASRLSGQGVNQAQMGNFDRALKLFEEADRIEPKNPTIYSNIGLVARYNEEYQKAIWYFNESIKYSDSSYLAALSNLGLTYAETKEFDKAEKALMICREKAEEQSVVVSANLNLLVVYYYSKNCQGMEKQIDYFFDIENTVDNDVLDQVEHLQKEKEKICP